jgi:energy-coupling factor transport system ATP-binding protein
MLIQVDHIHFTYPGSVEALRGVSLAIQPGELVALVGENGSGKTTLARHLNGLLRPQAGRVSVGGWQTHAYSPAKLARRVAYAFQNPDEQLFRQRVWDEVAFGPQNLGYAPERVRGMVEQALELMGLSDLAYLNPRDLGYSGRKRVAVASALAMQTPVLVLDEPTAGLDAGEQEQLGQVIHALYQQGKTVVIISHDMDFVAENMLRVVLMRQGQIILDALTPHFFERDALLESSGLALPQMVRLSRCLGHAQVALRVEQFLDSGYADFARMEKNSVLYGSNSPGANP